MEAFNDAIDLNQTLCIWNRVLPFVTSKWRHPTTWLADFSFSFNILYSVVPYLISLNLGFRVGGARVESKNPPFPQLTPLTPVRVLWLPSPPLPAPPTHFIFPIFLLGEPLGDS